MKLTAFEKRLLTFCGIVIIVFSYLLYDDSIFFSERKNTNTPIAELIEKKQDVRLKFSESFSWTPARSDEKLFPYDSIFTGDNSLAVLKLQDGSTLKIDGQSLIVLSVYEGQLVLDLKSGSLSGDLSQNSKLLLKTRDGFQNLKGKDGKQFRLEKDFAGQSIQKVSRKPAESAPDQLIWKSPKHFRVNKQDPKTFQNLSWIKTGTIQETIIEISSSAEFSIIDKVMKTSKLESGLPLDLPDGSYYVRLKGYNQSKKQTATSTVQSFEIFDKKKLALLPPTLITQNINHSDTFDFPPVVKWSQVEQAQKYRVEISPTPRFERGFQFETGQSFYPWSSFQPGTYFVRVYSLGDNEISLPSDIGTIEVASQAPILQPIPKVLIRSKDAAKVGPQKVTLNWKHLGKKSNYRIEVSNDGTFRDARVVDATRGPASSVDVQKPGNYHFRVFATNKEGQPISPSSNVEVFNYQVKNILTPPKLWRPFNDTTVFLQQDDNPFIWLDWSPIPEAEKFIVEIALDEEFKQIVLTAETTENRYLVGRNDKDGRNRKKIPYGQYYWRVKSVNETEKADSDWSPTFKFHLLHKKKVILFE